MSCNRDFVLRRLDNDHGVQINKYKLLYFCNSGGGGGGGGGGKSVILTQSKTTSMWYLNSPVSAKHFFF